MLRCDLNQIAIGKRAIDQHDRRSSPVNGLEMFAIGPDRAHNQRFDIPILELFQQPNLMLGFLAAVRHDHAALFGFDGQRDATGDRGEERVGQIGNHHANQAGLL